MFFTKKTPKPEQTFVEVGERKIPAKIYVEMRRGVRFSLGKNGAILRMPILLPASAKQKELERFRAWVTQKIEEKGPEESHALGKTYQDGDQLQVGTRNYALKIDWTTNKTHSARLHGKTIHLRLTQTDNEANRTKVVRQLLSRVVAQDFQTEMERRVQELNHLFFKKTIKNVSLKYNTSNWGSCSNVGNINLSTCLLFAPDDVVDYVIIHELAHLLEMNHSTRFWKHVENAMPDYKEKKKWLKQNWQACNF
ncbi:MAG: M48 family metallopeptidase [Saprospiraceae bacterium]|nr:M48 family metallopeptidase [Saprospiraceae bacterium]MCF8249428.1 M48 family metallopeptidase [Saprospiraceae bacterium]MCF8279082.1 M48 family metallopeptidase [Bacteroidales bacterium]MCF8311557.1 M48 family metallopeptidase [Saprospiraceae bacterium]MCF8440047.1 M48 family metallopeptidase [Saprospiraceae bacterium]